MGIVENANEMGVLGFKERKPHVVGKELENINERLINFFINFFFHLFHSLSLTSLFFAWLKKINK